jgi:hypothetical protein
MKPRTLNLTVVAFALLLSAASSFAQTQKLSVSIPFDFQVGTQHMPAGQYAVATARDGYLLTIRSLHTSDTAQVMTNSVGSKHPDEEPSRLVFRSVGNEHYLVQVWSPGLQDGRSIALPKDRQIQLNDGGGNQDTTISAER